MKEEEELEMLERQNAFLLEHGTDVTLSKGDFIATLYFQRGKYQTKTTKEESSYLTGIEEPGVLSINKFLVPQLDTRNYSRTIPDMKIE